MLRSGHTAVYLSGYWFAMKPAEGERQAAGRLQGWKSIAGYLGVSQRTAQLWVKARGLPVRRLPGGRGGVYAEAAELDAWMRSEDTALRQARRDRRRQLVWASLAAPVLLAGAALAAWRLARAGAAVPESVLFQGNTLVANGREGRPLWRYRCDPPAEMPAAGLQPEHTHAMLADLDADGKPEVFASLGFFYFPAGLPEAMVSAQIACWSHEGALRWRRKPVPGVRDANGAAFPPHWEAAAMAMGRAGGRDKVWITLNHRERFPGVLAEVRPDGSLRELFANHGHINSLAVMERNGNPAILAGGATSALRGSFLGVIDPEGGFRKAPDGGPPRYRFAQPAGGLPLEYYWIPSSDLTEASLSDVDHVYTIRGEPDGPVAIIWVGKTQACRVFVEMDRSGRPLRARIAAACELEHRRFEKQGAIGHPFSRCPHFQMPLRLRRWTEDGRWEEIRLPMATMRNTV
jgi:hypothetical protein